MKIEISYITENRSLETVRNELLKARIVGFDCETTGLSAIDCKVRLLQLATVNRVFVLDCFQLSKTAIRELILEPVFGNPDIVKVAHNYKFDQGMIATSFDFSPSEHKTSYCTYIAAKLCTGGTYYQASLDNLAQDFLDIELDKTNQKYNWAGNIYKEQITYAALDAAVLIPLYHVLNKAINANCLQKAALLEMNAIAPICQLELNGILLDSNKWLEVAEAGREEMYRIETELRQYFGNINLGSTKQLCEGLSQLTGMNITSSSADSLKGLIDNYHENPGLFDDRDYRPAVLKIMEFKKANKQYDAFGPSFLNHVNKKTGRIHASFRQIDTNTGRMSCGSPNLQQLPRESSIRECFVAPPGKKIVTIDYSQIELRLLAQLTKDPGLVNAFENDLDLHTFTASEMYKVKMDRVLPNQRQAAKTISFGIPYGMGAAKLAFKLNIPVAEAKDLLQKYYDSYPGLTAWFDAQKDYFKEFNCIRTSAGTLKDVSQWRRDEDKEWAAIQASKNTPIQGASANIIKLAISRMHSELPSDIKLVNCVHDETVSEVPEDYAAEYAEDIQEVMLSAAKEYIPDIKVTMSCNIGDTWSK